MLTPAFRRVVPQRAHGGLSNIRHRKKKLTCQKPLKPMPAQEQRADVSTTLLPAASLAQLAARALRTVHICTLHTLQQAASSSRATIRLRQRCLVTYCTQQEAKENMYLSLQSAEL